MRFLRACIVLLSVTCYAQAAIAQLSTNDATSQIVGADDESTPSLELDTSQNNKVLRIRSTSTETLAQGVSETFPQEDLATKNSAASTSTAEQREEENKRLGQDPALTAEERETVRAQTQSPERPRQDHDGDIETAQQTADLRASPLLPDETAETSATRPALRPVLPLDDGFSPYTTGDRWQTFHPSQGDPFAPLGLRMGSFVAYPEVVLEARRDSNVFLSDANRSRDSILEFRPSVQVESDWNRHALAGAVRGTLNTYDEFDSENETSLNLQLKGRLDLNRRTNLAGEFYYDIDQEGRSSLDFPGAAAERTDINTYGARLHLNHRINRLALSIKGSFNDIDYGSTPLVGGGTQSNADRDYDEIEGALRLTYDFKPGFAVFADAQIGRREYDQRIDDSGFERSSDRYALKGGVLVDIGPKLRGEFGVGYKWQKPDDTNLVEVQGAVLDAMLEWRPRQHTTVTLNARSDIDETSFSTAAGILERFYSAEVRHELRRQVAVTAGVSYFIEDYQGTDTEQNTFQWSLGSEYLMSRRAALLGDITHTRADGDGGAQEYRKSEFRLGVRLRP